MFNNSDELEDFKIRIDLRAYAASLGYSLDAKSSWRGTSVMRNATNDDKVIIKRDIDHHYVFFSVRDDRDNGSIIDFIQNRNRGMSLGAVRKELRPWLGHPPVPVPVFASLPTTSKDRMKVEAAYALTQEVLTHAYLERERALPAALFALDRFAGRVRKDQRGNAIFPHFDQDGMSGYEIRNKNFQGFASGGTKSMWLSHEYPDDARLVITEGAIDALSFAVLHPDNHARYASIGGKPNAQQKELIRSASARLPVGGEVISAMDNDNDGDELTEMVRDAVRLSGRTDLLFAIRKPVGFKDWNDALRARPLPLLPFPRREVPYVA